MTFGPVKYLGNKVEIRIEVTVPPYPEQIVQAVVTIQGNGKQRFVVPVSVAVEKGHAPPALPDDLDELEVIEDEVDDSSSEEFDEPTSWGDWFNRLWK